MTRRERYGAGAIRILLIDSHPLARAGLSSLIQSAGERMVVAAVTANAMQALTLAENARPDVILIDMEGKKNGVDAIGALIEKFGARVIALASGADAAARDAAVLAGARGVVSKEDSPEGLMKAIEKVHAGELWLDRSATGRVFVELSRRIQSEQADERKRRPRLTPRELQIVRLLTKEPETSIVAIARKIHTSENTLRNHLTSIYAKVGVSNRLQLHLYATKHHLD